MTIRKQGTASDQQVDTTDDPGQGQGIRREGVQAPRRQDRKQALTDDERRDVIDGDR